MRRLAVLLALAAAAGAAQNAANSEDAQGGPATDEQTSLSIALAESGTSPPDFIRALETHLRKFPETERRAEMEEAIAKTAMEMNDRRRIIEYGQRVIARGPTDPKLLERVTRELLEGDDKASSERALKYARQYETMLLEAKDQEPPKTVSLGDWMEEVERGLGRAYVLQARATGNLGNTGEALELARKSYAVYPNAESAREIGRWLVRSGNEAQAVAHFADAFAIPDSRQRDSDRAADRARLGELYRKLHGGSEQGLGELVLAAYDRTTALIGERRLRLKQLDPNLGLTNPMEFTLKGLDGGTLKMQSLAGKVVVMDFWATWCVPCRAQHPLYEEVKKQFSGRDDVVFLSINADDDRSGVQRFLEENNWDKRVYFESGLVSALRISSIPTAILINRRGELHSRMAGFIPSRFAAMLAERIELALAE
ncbi:MAG: thioredoxin-like domain-containing protein [bacterium]